MKNLKKISMKNVVEKLRNYSLYMAILLVVFSVASCSDDDDGIIEPEPTGMFDVEAEQVLMNNMITLETVTVGQDSWLVAVMPGDEMTNNFISDPVFLEEGVNTDVELTLDDSAIPEDAGEMEIVLKLYAENPTEGTMNEWDELDEAIMDENNVLVTETITVILDSSMMAFSDFDTDGDGNLNAEEVPMIYQDDFAEWDTNDDGMLNREEFDMTTFSLTDMNNDEMLSEDEWNDGFNSFFGNWVEDDFATFDANADGNLTDDEWNEAFADSEWFSTFDADGSSMVAEDEWDTGLFNDWDTNDDDMIDENEFNVFGPFATMW